MVHQIATKAEFDQVLANAGDKAVIVDFTATWCGPCQFIGPKFLEFAGIYTNIEFFKVDVDENDETAGACGVQAMPTFMVFKNGKKIDQLRGASEERLKELCEMYN